MFIWLLKSLICSRELKSPSLSLSEKQSLNRLKFSHTPWLILVSEHVDDVLKEFQSTVADVFILLSFGFYCMIAKETVSRFISYLKCKQCRSI